MGNSTLSIGPKARPLMTSAPLFIQRPSSELDAAPVPRFSVD
ncbi:hypothetical protein P0E70_13125 [Enterococcus faecalis]|nr:hypothetical protein [Enterococcus faecalis]